MKKTLELSFDSKEIKPVNPKGNQPWTFIGRTDADAETPILGPHDVKSQLIGEDPTHWWRPWCWERLRAGEKEGDRGWVDWMASLTQWTWVQTNKWWRTRKYGMLQFMGLQRVGHSLVTEQKQPGLTSYVDFFFLESGIWILWHRLLVLS